jgi:capsular polysaccharide transport system permease protein
MMEAILVSEQSADYARDDFGRDEPGAAEPSGSRALAVARDVRAASRRARRLREVTYLAVIVAGVLAALCWGMFVVAPRYEAEARFAVRGSSPQGQTSGATGLLSSGTNGGAVMGFVDGFAVNDFLKSRDCMLQLGKRVDLAKLLSPKGYDPMSSIAAKPSQEALYKAYSQAVSVRFNLIEQENVISVDAFSPDGSQKIAGALLTLAEEFVQRMDAQGVQNTLDVDTARLREAEDQAMGAANAVAAWRSANRNVDPEAESTMVLQMIGQIENELTTARIAYAKVRAFGNPDHPMLAPAKMQVEALEGQLAGARQRLAGGDNSQASRLRSYTQLKNAQTFADTNLSAARDAYQQAVHETSRLRRYLTVIARPVAEDRPGSPNLALLALEGLLVGMLLAFALSLALGSVRTSSRT